MSIIPFDDRDGFIWMDGAMIPWREAKLHVLSHGLHYGSSVFEGERCYAGKIFKDVEHAKRFHTSAELVGFTIPYSVETLVSAKAEVLKANNIVDGYVRPVAWRGSEMMAISAQHNTIHVAIAAWAWPSMYKADIKEKGIRLTMAKYKRPSPETEPTASKAAGLYMICTISKHEAERQGFDDALMLDYRGYLAEATGANLFLVIRGELHTPAADCFLNGITRQTVIERAKALGITVHERHIAPDELATVQEVFLTGTAAELTPVSEIAGQKFNVGPITKQLMEDYSALVRAHALDKAA
ncbi:MAG: branched-chain amino acid aminotransferase [Rhodospirillales bacterium 12-54-5]|nr:MAG: branched-chain amino acid aminotransferase [Rhodospirillales bacterium 12-54-5]